MQYQHRPRPRSFALSVNCSQVLVGARAWPSAVRLRPRPARPRSIVLSPQPPPAEPFPLPSNPHITTNSPNVSLHGADPSGFFSTHHINRYVPDLLPRPAHF